MWSYYTETDADAIRKSYGYGETAKLNRRMESKCNRVKQRTGLRMRSDWFTYKNVSFIDRAHNAYILCVQKWRVSISRCVHDTHTHTPFKIETKLPNTFYPRATRVADGTYPNFVLRSIANKPCCHDRVHVVLFSLFPIDWEWFFFWFWRCPFPVVRFVQLNGYARRGIFQRTKTAHDCRAESEWMWCGCSDRRDLW